jgi:hypothetical protein
MARLRFRGRRQQQSRMLLLVALGAVTGLALGVMLAERSGGTDGLTARARGAKRPRRSPDIVEDDVDAEHFDLHEGAVPHPDEAELEARVLEVFRNDPTLQGRAIDIGAIGSGTIELTGWVHSAEELAHALTLARGVPDVADVMDSLAVRGSDIRRVGESPTDR